LERGKHVYCEKPLTHSMWEVRSVGEAAHAAGTATQMGNTGQASDGVRRLKEYLDAGAIGPVREVHVWTNRPIWPQGLERPEPPLDVPPTLDWDRWLGPAPERPFHSLYHPFNWRGWWDFGTGAVGDIACHRFAPIFYALELGAPIAVEAHSTAVNNETYPSASLIRYEFPARGDKPAVNIHWYDGGLKPFRPQQLDGNTPLEEDGAFYIGDEGVMMDGAILPAEKHAAFPEPPQTLPRSPGHWEEWIAACHGEDVSPGMNFAQHAGPLTEAVLLGNIALKFPKRLEWDSPNLRFANDDDANTHLRRDYRDGWEL
ncbi:MAG: gfo/Idh/MocA family oxidoreductase, partial [Candidatus Hydrogenedentales bacterium]